MRLPLHLLWHCFAAAPPPVHVDVHLLPARTHVTRAFLWLVGVEDGHDPATRARLTQRIEDMASPARVVPWKDWSTNDATADATADATTTK